jgi:hypothetical protein
MRPVPLNIRTYQNPITLDNMSVLMRTWYREKPFQAIYTNETYQEGQKYVKLHVHVVDTYTLYDFQVYTGKAGGVSENGLAHRVVIGLVSQLSDQGIVLCIDNFFTGFPLVKELSDMYMSIIICCWNSKKKYKGLSRSF